MKRSEPTYKSSPFIILAPANAVVPASFSSTQRDNSSYHRFYAQMQIMRGRVALQEGAIRKEHLDSEMRHHMPGDANSWHLLRVGEDLQIRGCARILVHPHNVRFSALRLATCALARSEEWRRQVRFAVEADLAVAKLSAKKLMEPGGWVLEERLRGTQDAISIALSAFAWSQLIGNCIAYVTATVKHGSSSILKRLGGNPVRFAGTELPSYYEQDYGCQMELLKFDNQYVSSRFAPLMSRLNLVLAESTVLQARQEPKELTELAA